MFKIVNSFNHILQPIVKSQFIENNRAFYKQSYLLFSKIVNLTSFYNHFIENLLIHCKTYIARSVCFGIKFAGQKLFVGNELVMFLSMDKRFRLRGLR